MSAAEPTPHADLLNVAATLARLDFFAGEEADQISDRTHENVTRLAMRIKRALDIITGLEHELLATAVVLRGIIREQLGADFIDPEVGGALAVAAHMDATQLARFLAAELREPGSYEPPDETEGEDH